MTFLRSLLHVTAAVVLAAVVPACAASETGEGSELSADKQLSGASLKSQSIVQGSLVKGGTLRFGYDPKSYDGSEYGALSGLPYMAVKVISPNAAAAVKPQSETGATPKATLEVKVAGDFPGSPKVLVVDKQFHVLASTLGTSTPAGDVATLEVADSSEEMFVLIRDEIWVRPMEFDVTVSLPEVLE